MRNILSILFSFFVIIGIYPQAEQNYQFQIVRKDGEAFLKLVKYIGSESIPKVPIEFKGYKVISIGESAFSSTEIKSITIPSSIIDIGKSAFYGCKKLTDVVLEEGVKSIGEGAFLGCSSLRNISLPMSLENIGDSSFEFCSSLSKIVIPEKIIKLNCRIFAHCEKLVNVKLPTRLRNIEALAFAWCPSLKEIEFPNTLESIGYEAFSPSGLENIIMSDSMSRISIFNSFTYAKLNIKSQLLLEKLVSK